MTWTPPALANRLKTMTKQHGKKAFWLWVIYQAVKGTLTTSLIWVPLILATCHFSQ